MISASNFVWIHLMKTGGHAVAQALQSALKGRRDVRFDSSKGRSFDWHHSTVEREHQDPSFTASGKTIICGFRRLPAWILSRVHYEATRSPFHCASREMIVRGQYFENLGQRYYADLYLSRYLSSPVDCWVRHEFLIQDFTCAFGSVLDRRLPVAVKRLGSVVNPTPNYIKELSFHFTDAELRTLYGANPLWAELEHRLYGDLVRIH